MLYAMSVISSLTAKKTKKKQNEHFQSMLAP